MGADLYMKNHVGARERYRQATRGGQKDLDFIHQQGDVYYVTEAKGRKPATTSRDVPGETSRVGSPAQAIQGSQKYLELTLDDMLDRARATGDTALAALITNELQPALRQGKLIYQQVWTVTQLDGSAYFSVKRFKLGGN